jgi:hypothetical protein
VSKNPEPESCAPFTSATAAIKIEENLKAIIILVPSKKNKTRKIIYEMIINIY